MQFLAALESSKRELTEMPYISPNIVCFSVEYSLCAGSPSDGGHKNAEPDPDPLEPVDEE